MTIHEYAAYVSGIYTCGNALWSHLEQRHLGHHRVSALPPQGGMSTQLPRIPPGDNFFSHYCQLSQAVTNPWDKLLKEWSPFLLLWLQIFLSMVPQIQWTLGSVVSEPWCCDVQTERWKVTRVPCCITASQPPWTAFHPWIRNLLLTCAPSGRPIIQHASLWGHLKLWPSPCVLTCLNIFIITDTGVFILCASFFFLRLSSLVC